MTEKLKANEISSTSTSTVQFQHPNYSGKTIRMETPPGIPQPLQQQQENTAKELTLQVNFSWKQLKSLITNKDDPQSTPIYIVHYRATKPHLIFKFATDDTAFATGSLHAISIDADCEIRSRHFALKALKRFKTEYTHLSYAFSNNNGGASNDNNGGAVPEPARMTWTSTCGFKTWDFICFDENQMPVAKFSANVWGVKKIGYFTFMGSNIPSACAIGHISDEVREEIVVTGLTLFYCMVLRTNNIFSLFGAIFSRPGQHDGREEEEDEQEKAMSKIAVSR
ncbi:hypothetical protein ACJ72_06207 [Emergomyces africanus]|uniref:Uncharacterized protein n=1 Tax=Emergomyces africanus TaxID=1955775 RepID=A0A1B7NRW5_9EURO|nr:hypothetical protein ACJ72_06207 [Emergomyces africanus]